MSEKVYLVTGSVSGKGNLGIYTNIKKAYETATGYCSYEGCTTTIDIYSDSNHKKLKRVRSTYKRFDEQYAKLCKLGLGFSVTIMASMTQNFDFIKHSCKIQRFYLDL